MAGNMLVGLRFRLGLLVLLACAPLIGLTLHTAHEERRRVVAAWSEQSQRMTWLADQEELALRRQALALLMKVSKLPAVQSGNRKGCQKALEEELAGYPDYANLAVYDTGGEVLASALPVIESGSQADRKLFRRVLARGGRFAVGDYTIDKPSGKPAVTFGYPVLDEAESVRGIVAATVKLEWLGRARSELSAQIPPRATWTEIDTNGLILARYPTSELSSGQRFPNAALVKTVLGRQDGLVEVADATGTPAFCAFAWRNSQLVPGKVATMLSIPRDRLFAEANRVLLRNLAWLGAAVSLALGLSWIGSNYLFVRPVKSLVRASTRLAAGELSARTGLRHGRDELGRLARAFDQMAQALEERERERQLAEETLQTRDDIIRQLPLQPAAVCVCDRFGAVELYNQAAVDLWGYDPRDHHGSRRFCGSHQLFHSDGTPMPHSESPAAQVLRAGVALRNQELVVGRPDGTRVPVLANVVPLRDVDGSLIGVVSSYQDISERKRAAEAIRESNDKLQSLSRRLVESQETERRHIARELHDEVGQTLTVAEMNLQAMMQSSRAPSAGRVRLKESLQAVERVLQQVRDLSLNLRPSMLDDLGLEPALRWYTKRQASLAGLAAEFRADALADRLDPVIETACFRVAQEALTNVVRHAQARAVTVELRQAGGRLHLFVRDDGVGFDVAALREQAVLGASLGLLSMEERATLSDGGLEYKSTPEQGTEVHAWFPLKWRTVKA